MKSRQIQIILIFASGLFASGLSLAASSLFIYPTKGQDAQQQEKDKFDCYQWARQNTGIDPAQISTASGGGSQSSSSSGGAVARGAAGGALTGAIIGGASGGSAGKGAAIGAVGGGLFGGVRHDRQQQQQSTATGTAAGGFAECTGGHVQPGVCCLPRRQGLYRKMIKERLMGKYDPNDHRRSRAGFGAPVCGRGTQAY